MLTYMHTYMHAYIHAEDEFEEDWDMNLNPWSNFPELRDPWFNLPTAWKEQGMIVQPRLA